jgi:hypothetical protein
MDRSGRKGRTKDDRKRTGHERIVKAGKGKTGRIGGQEQTEKLSTDTD